MFKINVNKFKKVLKKLPWIVAYHAFFSCLVLFLLAFAFGILIFNKYRITISSADFKNIESPNLLDYEVYNNVLKIRQEENEKFNQADSEEYFNLFDFQEKVD